MRMVRWTVVGTFPHRLENGETISPEANDGLVLLHTPYGPEWIDYQEVEIGNSLYYFEEQNED